MLFLVREFINATQKDSQKDSFTEGSWRIEAPKKALTIDLLNGTCGHCLQVKFSFSRKILHGCLCHS